MRNIRFVKTQLLEKMFNIKNIYVEKQDRKEIVKVQSSRRLLG
jgi:hypothetical protein